MLERSTKITLNLEHKHMLNFAKDYDHLPLIAKVEVFEYALQNSEGNDQARSIGFVGPGVALIGLTMANHPSIAPAWLTLAVGLKSFSHCGFLVNLQQGFLGSKVSKDNLKEEVSHELVDHRFGKVHGSLARARRTKALAYARGSSRLTGDASDSLRQGVVGKARLSHWTCSRLSFNGSHCVNDYYLCFRFLFMFVDYKLENANIDLSIQKNLKQHNTNRKCK
ncbi:hypothetical protein ACSBR2_004306 [Camellia fascicularis]